MSKILSQDEIDALLASSSVTPAASERDSVDIADGPSQGGVVIYNFRRPDRVSKEQLRSLHFLHDRFAQVFTSGRPKTPPPTAQRTLRRYEIRDDTTAKTLYRWLSRKEA